MMRNILIVITYFILPWISLFLVKRAIKKGYLYEEDKRAFWGIFIVVGIINTIGLMMFWGHGSSFVFVTILLICMMFASSTGKMMLGIVIVAVVIWYFITRFNKERLEELDIFDEEGRKH
ncbi:hypothetical protein QTL86_17195 [Cellulosilyticum sp. ST5]|uniref:hypothetical protein n=1 Tax=Cellulosilyticum sp. ST5 TaxID=3055805 RepID=UPI003977A8FB